MNPNALFSSRLLIMALLLSLPPCASADTDPRLSHPIFQTDSGDARTAPEAPPVDDLIYAAHEWYLQAGQAMDGGGYDKAAELYRRAAEAGHVLAMHNLAVELRSGRHMKKSLPEAAHWYRKAAEMGLAASRNNLGDMYEAGDGLPNSPGDAVYWYTQSAMQGEPTAYMSLGDCFAKGFGVRKDFVEAFFWLTLAERNLPDGMNKRDTVASLAKIRPEMSLEQLDKATRRANNFRPLTQTPFPMEDRKTE